MKPFNPFSPFKQMLAAGLLAATMAPAMADAPVDHPVIKRAFKLAPSADLSYTIKAKQRGIALAGESISNWRAGDGKYSLLAETKVPLFGKILEQRSDGAVDDYGLAPSLQWYPVQIRNTEASGALTTQTVSKITVSDDVTGK